MAKMAKGAKRYLLFRGRDEVQKDIVIDVFNRKELQEALKKGRVSHDDHLVKVEVLGKVDPAKL